MPDRRRPNIVLIMTDQQRADFTADAGFPFDTMPFVDGLGREGTRFDRAYTPMPTCTPARTSLMTGRFPKATRVKQNWAPAEHVVFEKDLPQVLRESGYSVNIAGKNHSYLTAADFDFHAGGYSHTNGPEQGRTAEQEAFDEWLFKLDHRVSDQPSPFPLETQLCHRIVDDAIECVDGRGEKPFFLWLSLPEPHNPYQVPDPYYSMFDPDQMPERSGDPAEAEARGGHWKWLRDLFQDKRPQYDGEWRRYRAVYAGMLRMLDDQIARFVGHLKENGLYDDTILIFVSDHGDYVGDHGLQRKGVGLPECLTRVPMILRGPGIEASRNAEDFVSLVDLMPTLCDAIDAPIPFGVQGRSLWPMLCGQSYPKAEFDSIYAELGIGGPPWGAEERPPLHFDYDTPVIDELNAVTQSGNTKMVRKGRWKAVYGAPGGGELYDLDTDPGELRNLFDDPAHAAPKAEMLEVLLRWTIRTEDPLPRIKYVPKTVEKGWQWTSSPASQDLPHD
ncbi:sulfatase [Pelagovum pacificum]|uniref:DUF229 domain-containing protein n=1 Tax=Pelagovum pacificum TaxID=2588711 RepID=A0A5C5GEW0_9RHOB|nr:sulfatase-like hydrolase/transferase [Pelagovum pacificum]QQA43560.1 sulfatase-like hydrolase/transferase [Pelagovum pacificum]TNY33302.1 DUF229 domain-containing protein [Pelagovum pacificum]